MQQQDSVSSGRIGPDELYEILSWMPAKSAIRYSTLCKSLFNLTSESSFVEKQSTRGHDNGFFMQPKHRFAAASNLEFHALPCSGSGVPRQWLCGARGGRILSSSNGLLLIGYKPEAADAITDSVEFWVCNPATATWARIRTPDGFGFMVKEGQFSPLIECRRGSVDFYTVAFLVMTGEEEDMRTKLLLYSDGEWEEELCDVEVRGRWLRYDMPVVTFSEASEGLVVHYLSEGTRPSIVAFDLRRKRLWRETELPEGAWEAGLDYGWGTCNRLGMFKWDDASVCLVRWCAGEFKVWVLGSEGAWRKVMEMRVEEEVGVVGYGVASGDKRLAVAAGGRVRLCGMEGENKGRWEVVGEHGFGASEAPMFVSYANTLRPVCV